MNLNVPVSASCIKLLSLNPHCTKLGSIQTVTKYRQTVLIKIKLFIFCFLTHLVKQATKHTNGLPGVRIYSKLQKYFHIAEKFC